MAEISEIKQMLIDYQSGNGLSKRDIAERMFNVFDSNGNGKIDARDRMSEPWKNIFGFNIKSDREIDRGKLEAEIDSIANTIVGKGIEISEDLPTFPKDRLKIDQGVSYGNAIYKQLKGWSTDGNYKVATSYLQCVNKNNVIGVIEGFKAQSGDDGIMEYMDDEKGASELKGRARIPAALCELAEEVGVTDSPAYKYVKSVIEGYKQAQGADWMNSSKPFKGGHYWDQKVAGAAIGAVGIGATVAAGTAIGAACGCGVFSWATAGIGAAVGAVGGWITSCCQDDEAEMLDAQMEALIAEIKAKIGMEAAPIPTEE